MAYEDAGDSARARVHFDSARAMMEDSVARHPADPRLHIALGMSLAGLGRREEAIRAGRRAMDLAPLSSNVILATCYMGGAAEIFAYLGENDSAIKLLRVDPIYDKLRGDP